MDQLTIDAVTQHLNVTRSNLTLASYAPVALSLPFLEDAFHNLEAAIDTLRRARIADWTGPDTKPPCISTNHDALLNIHLTTTPQPQACTAR